MPPSVETDAARWEFAGLMTTYWCNARCAFCYVHGGPDQGGRLAPTDAVNWWRQLRDLAAAANKAMRIHLTGGEPFGDFEHLTAIVRAARDAGLTADGGLEKIETNAFWATDDEVVRRRVGTLDELGMGMLVVSADVFHQAFVPLDRVQRCVRVATGLLGESRVRVRWWDSLETTPDVAMHLERHRRERPTGRAADTIVDRMPQQPLEALAGDDCRRALLASRHVHIDPDGHVMPGTCSGIVLGCAAAEPIEAIWRRLGERWPRHPLLEPLVTGGPLALAHHARRIGYRPARRRYAGKCHLCTDLRTALFRRGLWRDAIGPAACYPADRVHDRRGGLKPRPGAR